MFNSRPVTDATLVQGMTGFASRGNWCFRPLIFGVCFLPAVLLLIVSALIGAENVTWPAQMALGFSCFAALLMLGDRPLLNPLQALVLVFVWWFAWGPAICSTFFYAIGEQGDARKYLEHDSGALWVVVLGLPLYALCAQITVRFARDTRFGLQFLVPTGLLYGSRILVGFASTAGIIYAVLFVLGLFGLRAYETINYLGGQLTQSPVLAAVDSITGLGKFATVGLLAYLAAPGRTNWGPLRLAVGLMMLANIGLALQSGSKGMIVTPLFFLGLFVFTYRQRVPWVLLLSLTAFYALVVEPFVGSSRIAAQRQGLTGTDERVELFREQLSSLEPTAPDLREINVESPFRGIYVQAQRVSAESSMFDGPWKGQSLRDGYSAVVPRFLDPNKAESNMGNFFARELGEIGSDNGSNTNIAITIPFEFVGNYGYLAGVLSFGLIGLFWSAFVCFLLTEARLATHPLAPLCVAMMLPIESSAGQFINSLKPMPIVLLAAWAVYGLLQRSEKRSRRVPVPA
jgi:hypothetical protein